MANGREEPKLSIKNIEDFLKDAKEDIFHPNVDKVFNHMRGATWTSNYDEILEKDYTEAKMTNAGRMDGNLGPPFPPSVAKSPPSGAEHRLIEFGERWHAEMKGTFESIARSIYSLMGNAKTKMESLYSLVGPNPKKIYDIDHSAEVAQNVYREREDRITIEGLQGASDTFRERKSIFENFRKDHPQLTRQPSYPPSNVATFLICSVVLGVETIINGIFYGAVSGYAYGFTIGLAFSFFIVTFSVISGRCFTYKNAADTRTFLQPSDDEQEEEGNKEERDNRQQAQANIQQIGQKAKKRIMLFWSVIFILLAFVVLMFAVIYRDVEFQKAVTDNGIWKTLSSLSFDKFGDDKTIILIILNTLIIGGAAWKGYHWEDVIPEYKQQAERFALARETYQNAITDAAGDVEGFIPSADDLNIKRYDREGMESLSEKYRLGCEHLETLKNSANEYLNSINRIIRARLDSYRIANREARDEHHPPDYFEVYPDLGGITIGVRELDQDLTEMFDKNIDKIVGILTGQRTEVIESFRKKYKKLYEKTIESHKKTSTKYPWEENSEV